MNSEWTYLAASVIGPGHIDSGLPCQDAWSIEWLDHACGLVVVADGAGSHESSHYSSRFVSDCLGRCTGQVLDVLKMDSDTQVISEKWRQIAEAEFDQTLGRLQEYAADNDYDMAKMGCTAILIVFSSNRVLTAHVGDGRACVSFERGHWLPLIKPIKGEQVGETLFITSVPWSADEQYWNNHAKVMDGKIRAFAAMTDGCERAAYEVAVPSEEDPEVIIDPNLPYVRFFEPVLDYMFKQILLGGSHTDAQTVWEQFLQDGLPALENESDDKTMVVVARESLAKIGKNASAPSA